MKIKTTVKLGPYALRASPKIEYLGGPDLCWRYDTTTSYMYESIRRAKLMYIKGSIGANIMTNMSIVLTRRLIRDG